MQKILSGIAMALDTIRGSKMRSFLTVLGVVIGTGTIIGVGSIIAGLDHSITELIRQFGPNTMIVFKFRGGFRTDNLTPEEWKRRPLTLANARAIEDRCPSVAHVAPYLLPDRSGIRKVRYKGNEVYQIQLGGTEEGYVSNGVEMLAGRFFTDFEN